MISRITLIEPKNDHLHIFSKFVLPRLGSILLATILRDRGYAAEALFMSRKEILARGVEADLVGLSTITATAVSAYALADHFREKWIPVVFGGPHVTFVPEEALEHGDYCIMGEGETGLPLLIQALNTGGSLSEVNFDFLAGVGILGHIKYPVIDAILRRGRRRGGSQGSRSKTDCRQYTEKKTHKTPFRQLF
jgi:radical SAM superfamily enzyme YgiQ (UPF0313 family)